MKALKTMMIVALLAAATTVLVGEEEKKSNPVKFGVELKQKFQVDNADNKSQKVFGDAEIYYRIELKGKIKITPGDQKIFTITPWAKERIEFRIDQDTSGGDIDLVGTPATTGNDEQSEGIISRVRNRVYLGVNFGIKIPKALNIGLDFVTRIANDVRESKTSAQTIEVQFAPVVSLSGGDYGVGLDWGISVLPGLVFKTDASNGPELQAFDLDFTVDLEFEFFHFFAPKDFGGAFYFAWANEIDITGLQAGGTQTTDWYRNNMEIGLKFKIYGIGLWTAVYISPVTGELAPNQTTTTAIGTTAGVGFKKDWFGFKLFWVGNAPVSDSAGGSYGKPSDWNNHIGFEAKIAL
jgi:hypothetical protein